MKNELLLIPDKADIERDAIANTWIHNGGEVLRVDKFWEHPTIDAKRVTIYGIDTFSLVLAQVIGVTLIEPKDEVISKISQKWIKRKIMTLPIATIEESLFPTFIKPVKPKTFTSQVYNTYTEFLKETKGIAPEEAIILSEILQIDVEVRAFILQNKILDLAFYEGSADLKDAKKFLHDFLSNHTVELPNTYVIDVGYNTKNGWFIIEFNASWGAGLNGCHPDKVISGIREATTNHF
ncbi:ATP-grasp domain-containing protein [uncultured Dokdonia sp.]|uniref:ATP-grasp domain-containing protein n=1 Tax=uncultured Dokdonia sp. TaxID=575653 RepID=UPI002619A477|nr:ATP-grasp domain-containing protein [uncultured Dokdonia sp.]